MTIQTQKKAQDMLRAAKLRRTSQRTAVLGAMINTDRPLTGEQILEHLGPTAPNKVTVYRTLESLIAAKLVHRAYLQDRAWHFELADHCTEHQCHPHFTCTKCSRTHCMMEMSIPMTKSPHNGFVIRHQKVLLEGLCPNCNKKSTIKAVK